MIAVVHDDDIVVGLPCTVVDEHRRLFPGTRAYMLVLHGERPATIVDVRRGVLRGRATSMRSAADAVVQIGVRTEHDGASWSFPRSQDGFVLAAGIAAGTRRYRADLGERRSFDGGFTLVDNVFLPQSYKDALRGKSRPPIFYAGFDYGRTLPLIGGAMKHHRVRLPTMLDEPSMPPTTHDDVIDRRSIADGPSLVAALEASPPRSKHLITRAQCEMLRIEAMKLETPDLWITHMDRYPMTAIPDGFHGAWIDRYFRLHDL